jgi:alpha-tubulin suppressor-like RCC1 family protein
MGYVVLRPKQVNYFKDKVVRGVACGEAHTLALDAGGEVYSFGWGAYGQLGRGPWDTHLPAAEQIAKIPTLTHVWKVSCGLLFSSCLTDTGQVWTWGSGEAGQLGRGATFTQSSTPQQIETLAANVIDVICGESHVLTVNKLGEMYAWGLGMSGKLEGFEQGMEVVCFLPQRIGGVETAWAVAGPQQTQEFASSLLAKLQQLQDRNIDSV